MSVKTRHTIGKLYYPGTRFRLMPGPAFRRVFSYTHDNAEASEHLAGSKRGLAAQAYVMRDGTVAVPIRVLRNLKIVMLDRKDVSGDLTDDDAVILELIQHPFPEMTGEQILALRTADLLSQS